MAEIFRTSVNRAQRIGAITRKEISTLITDKIAIFILFIFPVVLILSVGLSAPRSDLTSSVIWIIDEDHTQKSQEFIDTFKNTFEKNYPNLLKVYATGDLAPIMPEYGQDASKAFGSVTRENAEKYISTQYLSAYIILPEGYENELNTNGTVHISIYYDSIDLTKRVLTKFFILLGLTQIQLDNMLFERDIFYYPETRPYDINAGINILELGAPMIIGLMLFMSMNLVSTQCIVGDIPLQRLLTTPVYRAEVVLGKILAYTIMGTIQIIISMLLIKVFNLTMNCLWIDLFIVLLLNSIAGICTGVFISTISKTRLQASQLFLLFFFVTLVALFFARIEWLLLFIPLEQTRVAYAALAYRGQSLSDVLPQLGLIIGNALLFYMLNVIYIKYFKKEFV